MGVPVVFLKITLCKDSLLYFINTRVSIEVVVDGRVCGLFKLLCIKIQYSTSVKVIPG